jgi:HEAT repeat protein
VQVKDGQVAVQKTVGPLDELLKQLENPTLQNVESAQTAIVESIQLGDREALVGQTERLKKLVDDRRVDVRRTAVWALGRGGDLRIASLLVRALEDPDLDVAVEAHAALCALSRKPSAFGLPDGPYADLPEDATPEQKLAAAKKWRTEATKQWQEWYVAIRPYDERDLLLESTSP